MLIYLMRHGEAADRAATDQERELTRNGAIQNRSVIQKFAAQSPSLQKLQMSPYQRARQTATALRSVFPSIPFEVNQKLLPEADVYELMSHIESQGVQQLMLVGHNPLLSALLCLLVDGLTDSGRNLGTSHIACISMDLVAPGCGDLVYLLEP